MTNKDKQLEAETIIRWDEDQDGEELAIIYTSHKPLHTRLVKMGYKPSINREGTFILPRRALKLKNYSKTGGFEVVF